MSGFGRIAAAFAISLAVGTGAAQAQELKKVSFALSFATTAAVANFYAAQDGGFFKKHGLDVEIVTPANAADSLKLLAADQVQFAIVNSPDVILARDKGLGIRSIAANNQFGTAGIMVPVEENVKSLKDLEGKNVAYTSVPANKAMLNLVLKKAGVDLDKVNFINVGFNGMQFLLAGRVNALGDAISYAEPVRFSLAKNKPEGDTSAYVFFPFYKNGGPRYYVYNIDVNAEYLAKNPDVAKKFLAAWREATEWSIANPAAAADYFIKRNPNADRISAEAAWKSIASIITSPDTQAHGLGWQNGDIWTEVSDFMSENKFSSVRIDPKSAYTNEFLPPR